MEILKLNIDLIKPYWRNPRKNEKAVDAVVESIRRYGMNVPLVVDANHVILTGHTRYKALRRLGVSEVPVIVMDMDEKKARQFRIADNKAHEFSEWSVDQLKEEMEGLLADTESHEALVKLFGEVDWREMLALSSMLPDANENELGKAGMKPMGVAPVEPTPGGSSNTEPTVTVICPHCLEDCHLTKKDFDPK